MKHKCSLSSLSRNSSSKIIPSNYMITTSSNFINHDHPSSSTTENKPLISFGRGVSRSRFGFTTLIQSFLTIISIPTILPTFKWLALPSNLSLTPTLGRKITGTLFGNRRGHVTFAVQYDPQSIPILLIEFAMSTSSLVKEMSSGLVRIALECEKAKNRTRGGDKKLFNEPTWTMYCNGKKCGYATSRVCLDSDWSVLSMVQSVSVGAGVIPVVEDGGKRRSNGGGSESELLYMRARFERVVGSRDSEAYYMMNPDGNGGLNLVSFYSEYEFVNYEK